MNYQEQEINEIIYLLSTFLSFHPEIRVGQTISNAAFAGGWNDNDVFYCPNDVIINGLKELISRACKE